MELLDHPSCQILWSVLILTFLFLKLNLLGWHWLIRSSRFQVYIFLWYFICMLHCAPTTQSQIIFQHHIFGSLHPSFPTSFFLVTTILLSVSMSFCLFVISCLVSIWHWWSLSSWNTSLHAFWFPPRAPAAPSESPWLTPPVLATECWWLPGLNLFLGLHSIFFKILFIFREREREGERKGEEHPCAREILNRCLSHRGPGLPPRHVPWLGI